MSHLCNQYRLVTEDYFSKWPFAVPLSDQTAVKIVRVLKNHLFTLVGPLRGYTLTRTEILRVMYLESSARHLEKPNLDIIPWVTD